MIPRVIKKKQPTERIRGLLSLQLVVEVFEDYRRAVLPADCATSGKAGPLADLAFLRATQRPIGRFSVAAISASSVAAAGAISSSVEVGTLSEFCELFFFESPEPHLAKQKQ
jgi:hypothetical protein